MKRIQMNGEVKKIVERIKAAQTQLQDMLKQKSWLDDARKFAERQGKEVRKLLESDVVRVREFIMKERKELERLQKQLPSEVKKFRKFVDGQKKELEKLLSNVRPGSARKAGTKKRKSSALKGLKARRRTASESKASGSTSQA